MKAGRTITVTERGKTVGYLMPAKTNLDDRLEAMRGAGLLSWSGKRPKINRPTFGLKGGGSLTDIISENRE
jgi:antitoxin (DNA-binding transcriptional repressor) of toxin-antitoxin stability system